jgi:hypothetical protein
VRHHAIGPDPDPVSPKPDPDPWHNASGPRLHPDPTIATAPHAETRMGQGGRMGVMGAQCDSPCDPSPPGAHSPDPAPIPASPANTYGTGQDGDMGLMGGRSVSPLSTDPHPDPNPTLLPRAPTPDPEPTSTPPAATHGTGRGVVMGVKGDRSDSTSAAVHADPAPIPILGQGEVSQAQLCQPPPTRHPHMVHDHGHVSTAGIVLYVVLYTLLADAPVHVSLCMWGMWATVAWGMFMVGPSLITAATRACMCVHSAYMAASDKQLKVFLALLAVSVLFLCPWAAAPSSGFSSQFLTAHSTEFVVYSATTSVNVVGVFNSFVGTGINDATRNVTHHSGP